MIKSYAPSFIAVTAVSIVPKAVIIITGARGFVDGRSADTLEAAGAVPLQVADGRSPDTLDAAGAPQPVAFVQPGGFDWADAGIGAALAAALLALLTGSMLFWFHRRQRRRVQAT